MPADRSFLNGRSPSAAPMDREALKRQAGEAAAALVTPGMRLGLGTGSTVRYTIEALGRAVAAGLDVVGVPTSRASEELARKVGVPLTTLDETPRLDLTIDGADELDGRLDLIKGGGGALTREKVVAKASRRMAVVADAAKRVPRLGTTFALPVEVLAFGMRPVREVLERLGATVVQRKASDGRAFVTDNGNPILDARWADGIRDARALEAQLSGYPGVVCTGLFLGMCDTAFVAGASGVETIRRS